MLESLSSLEKNTNAWRHVQRFSFNGCRYSIMSFSSRGETQQRNLWSVVFTGSCQVKVVSLLISWSRQPFMVSFTVSWWLLALALGFSCLCHRTESGSGLDQLFQLPFIDFGMLYGVWSSQHPSVIGTGGVNNIPTEEVRKLVNRNVGFLG